MIPIVADTSTLSAILNNSVLDYVLVALAVARVAFGMWRRSQGKSSSLLLSFRRSARGTGREDDRGPGSPQTPTATDGPASAWTRMISGAPSAARSCQRDVAAPSHAALSVEHLVKRYGALTAVDDVSFDVAAGSVVALLGPNGAGKTTTMEILEGLARPTEGRVHVLGFDPLRGDRAWRARLGLVLQSSALDAQLTVAEALSVFGRLYPHPWPVEEILELVSMSTDSDTRIGVLSGGQRRRVDVAVGIIGRPELLFLDEPTTGFDPEARRDVWDVIDNLTATGTTVLLTTHYLEEAQRLADRVIVLADGRVVADATPDEIRARAGASSVRFPLPRGVLPAELPEVLVGHYHAASRAVEVRATDIAAVLQVLISWARARRLDLTGLEVGPPSLEDAYLTLIGATAALASKGAA